MTTNAYVFRITLAMPGCFLVSAGACANEYFSERIRRPFREQTDDCVCTVLAAPHAYLAEYCPFERSFSNLPAGQWSPPSLVAFAFRELRRLPILRTVLVPGTKSTRGERQPLLHASRVIAPDKYTVTLTNIGEPHDALTPMPLRATLGNRVIETHYELPQRAKEQIRELHSLIEELREATRTTGRPADTWELVTGNNGHYASVQQLPVATVEEEIIKSTNAAEALTAITTPLRPIRPTRHCSWKRSSQRCSARLVATASHHNSYGRHPTTTTPCISLMKKCNRDIALATCISRSKQQRQSNSTTPLRS